MAGESHYLVRDRGHFSVCLIFLATVLLNSRDQEIFVDSLPVQIIVFTSPRKGWKRENPRVSSWTRGILFEFKFLGIESCALESKKSLRAVIHVAK